MTQAHLSPLLSAACPALKTLPKHDRKRFCEFGAGQSTSPTFPTITAAIQQMMAKHSDLTAAIAVREDGSLDEKGSITYGELDVRANKLAAVLRDHGVTNGDAVCLYLTRSIQMVVGIIATLKLGACYVPQHVSAVPDEQLVDIVNATETKVVLTSDEMEARLPAFSSHVAIVPIGAAIRSQAAAAAPLLPRPVAPSDRCYIIFTSGTTGAPKGVQVTHGNVANVLLTKPMDLGMRPGVKVSQILSIAFDLAAWEILGTFSHGGTLLIRHSSIANAVRHADVVISTPTVLGTMNAAEMQHVRIVAVAGEPCPKPLAEAWGEFATFYNACGPTETTIVNTAKRFVKSDPILTIGTPTPNNTVYVLDRETRKACRIGEVGEMWAGGACVSAGYLNRADLTGTRYVADPFCGNSGGVMYRTGDLGRWNAAGELEHFGRVDDQVKVKGFRVELDGVSAVAEMARGVTKAVVVKVGEDLVAHVSPSDVDAQSVKEAVRAKLPYYCVPGRVVCVADLPKTRNGKVDKRRLAGVRGDARGGGGGDQVEGPAQVSKRALGEAGLRETRASLFEMVHRVLVAFLVCV